MTLVNTEGANQKWTIQRNWQHRVHKNEWKTKQKPNTIYQGKGMLRKLNNELIKHHPTVKYASLVTASNLPELYSKINSGFLNLITIQVITM
jgi:hypothetical protein